MAITFTLHDKAVNDQTAGLQTGADADGFIDTDVAYDTLPATFRTFLETTLGLTDHSFPDAIGVATKTNSVTVNASTGSTLTGTTFTDSLGGALDGDDSGLTTLDGKSIKLFASGNDIVIGRYDSNNDNIVDATDAVAFVIFKQDVVNAGATSDEVTFHIVTYVPISHNNPNDPDDSVDLGNTLRLTANETLNFVFAGAPSGNNLFMMFGDPNSAQIVVIGHDPLNQSEGGNINTKDVVQISSAQGNTSFGVNGNAINPTHPGGQNSAPEGAIITYVTGANTDFLVPNLDQNEADVEANIQFTGVANATAASFTVNQTNPPGGPTTVRIEAFTTAAEPGVNFVDGLTNDVHVDILSASVVEAAGNTSTPVISISGGVLTISGLATGDQVKWTTDGTHNRVLIENFSNLDEIAGNDNNTFDIGGFSIERAGSESTAVGQQIVIDDDGPTAIAAQQTGTVDEDGVPGGIAGGVGDVAGEATVATGSVAPLFNSGTDTPLTFSLKADTSGLPALTSGGVAVTYAVAGNTLTASAGANIVFTFALNGATGAWTFTLVDQLDHPTLNGLPGDDTENDLAINLSSILKATDADGDSVNAAANALIVTVDDDTPTASENQQTGTVDEDGVPGGIAGGTGDVAGEATVATGNVGTLFNSGADQPLTFSLNADTSGLPALTSGGVAVTYAVAGNTLTASAGLGGPTVFTFALNGATGAWTFTLVDQLDHPTLNGLPGDDTENDLAINLSSILRATDFDGDTVAAAANALIVTVDDDTPTASENQQTGTVDEDGVPGGIAGGTGDVAGEATVATGNVGTLFNSGADQPLTFSLNADTSGLPALTSGGVAVTYAVAGNTLTASAGLGGPTVFTFALNGATGAWTFTLVDQLDHPTLNGLPGDDTENDLAINLSSILRATDFDGDTVAAAANALIVTVDDDTPTINPLIADGLVDFTTISGPNPLDFGGTSTSSVTHSLNGSAGADSPATFSVTSSPATVTIFDGTTAQLTLLRDISADATVVTYFQDADNSGTHNAGDTDFFKLTLSGGNYTFDVLQNPIPAETEFVFAGAPSGSNLFMMFGDPNSNQIVVIGHDPLNQSQGGNINTKDVLNISTAQSHTSFGVNGNAINPIHSQSNLAPEGAIITYVTGANTDFLVPNLSQNEADIEANIQFTNVFNALAASFTVNQTNPPSGPTTARIEAFTTAAEPGVNFVDGLTNDTHVNITSATVVEANPNDAIHAVATIGADGVLTVTGLATGDQVKWLTAATHNRVLIENTSLTDGIAGNNNNTFDIGGFSLIQASPTPDEKLDFTVQIADFDGDTASDSFSIGIDGTGINDNDHVDGVIA